ncbi:MAG TPA: response regulator transcription factor [Verrucomicrobiae bacterium]|jgi:DNA-binding NarL/FixJ family response regulator|nr:response regulator transcription factor [Verrucomicrobiae bacterium]
MPALSVTNTNLMTKVAIVEDNGTLRQYLAELINGTPGHRCVCTCATAEDALVQIPTHKPHVVLMDIHLPGESGIACTARLRAKLPDLQVIMLTVYKDIKMIFQALKAGACGYVLKRSDEREILDAIAEVRAGGAPMTSEIARMVVRSFMESPAIPDPAGTDQLSARELELLALLAEGFSNKEIAARLHISNATVRTHLMHIYEKLHVRCRTEAAAKYLRSNPTPPGKPAGASA